jgi:FAD:protein FMN transferase
MFLWPKDCEMKRLGVIVCLLAVIAILPGGLTQCTSPLQKFEDTRTLADTYTIVTVYSISEAGAKEAIDAAFARMEEITNASFGAAEGTEVFRLNRDGHIESASDDLVKLVEMSLEYNRLTGGSFDITVQPLLDLWAAGLWKETPDVQQTRITEALELVGSDKVTVDGHNITLAKPGMKITLGGIAAGYAVDEALKVLKDKGIESALIDIGGGIGTLGSKPGGEPWTVSVVNPDDTTQKLVTFNISGGKAVTTSGNYARYFDPNKSAGHVVDPKTGYSTSNCISITIIADTCAQADALDTGIFVLGPEDGMKLIESIKTVQGLMVDNDRNILRSSGLSQYVSE